MIKVLFFAHIQDVVGKESIIIDKTSLTVRDLKDELSSRFNIKNLHNIMFAINEEYAIDEDIIQKGDVVALIPPVSGG